MRWGSASGEGKGQSESGSSFRQPKGEGAPLGSPVQAGGPLDWWVAGREGSLTKLRHRSARLRRA